MLAMLEKFFKFLIWQKNLLYFKAYNWQKKCGMKLQYILNVRPWGKCYYKIFSQLMIIDYFI